MGNFVRNDDLMRRVDSSTAPLNEMLSKNDVQGAAAKLRDDIRTMDRDSFMVELGQVQKATENSPTHIVMHPITDEMGNLRGKDIALATTGVDMQQHPVDLDIPIGQLYGDHGAPCAEPIVIRPDCAFELAYRPGDGWSRENGVLRFGGRFPDGRVHVEVGGLQTGGLNINLGFGGSYHNAPPDARVLEHPHDRVELERERIKEKEIWDRDHHARPIDPFRH